MIKNHLKEGKSVQVTGDVALLSSFILQPEYRVIFLKCYNTREDIVTAIFSSLSVLSLLNSSKSFFETCPPP